MAPLLLLVHDVGMVGGVAQGVGLVPGVRAPMIMRSWGTWTSKLTTSLDPMALAVFAVSVSWSGGTMMSKPGTTVGPFSHSSGSAWSSSVCWGF